MLSIMVDRSTPKRQGPTNGEARERAWTRTTGSSAWYDESIAGFRIRSVEEVLGALAAASPMAITPEQRDAWTESVRVLRDAVGALDGWIALEFHVPRLGGRIDAVVLAGGVIIPIEFKVGQATVLAADREQVWDYALDLRHFHAASHAAPIWPLVVATGDGVGDADPPAVHPDGVASPRAVPVARLASVLTHLAEWPSGPSIDGMTWVSAPYRPTPTIIQAARALYARHTVDDITRNEAGATNLAVTSRRVEAIIDAARTGHHKAIVFVTGVPGAGKTLVGLDIATARRDHAGHGRAVFLSGNQPLVTVLREALARDEIERRKANGQGARKGEVLAPIKGFIQNVHHFRDDGIRDTRAPHDHVVIFDEAQRAWNRERTSDFMQRKKGISGFDESEPEFLVRVMDRHDEWSVVVCLVGGGQEIHTGEAGIAAWLEAMCTRFRGWHVHIAPQLSEQDMAVERSLAPLRAGSRLHIDPALHLSTSLRSFRASNLSAFVSSLLSLDVATARHERAALGDRYPLVATRDLTTGRQWVRAQARGSERYGLLASSQALRLRPHAIDVRIAVDPVHWFLGARNHTRSSWYLEEAATEFQVQGLELDWACVTWDADLRRAGQGWAFRTFRGDSWIRAKTEERQRNLRNAYRVLLTRARRGMVLVVPRGDPDDPTRLPAFYDETWAYLMAVGIPAL